MLLKALDLPRHLAFAALLALAPAALAEEGDAAAGERLYRHGIGADGEVLRGVGRGGLEILGDQLACVSCHRASGMGSSEGGTYVPPIAAPWLFAPREANATLRNERFKEQYKDAQPGIFQDDILKGRLRPAYDAETLKRVLRTGVDPADRELDPVMPRFELSDADADNLVAWLSSLSAEVDPGVEPDGLHFATIVDAAADPALADSVVALLEAFATWQNRTYRNARQHPNFSPYYRSEFRDSWRNWTFHVWRVEGDPSTWRSQLEARYRERPVFAVVGGLIAGEYAPVAEFCDHERLPCLFPIVDLPETDGGPESYSLHFSRGLVLEAEAAARYMADLATPPARIVQIHDIAPTGTVPARSFADAVARLLPDADLTDRETVDAAGLIEAVLAVEDADLVAVWPGAHAEALVAALAEDGREAPRVLLPSTALRAARAALTPELAQRLTLVWPYDDPDEAHPDAFRARAWVRSRRVPIVDWDVTRQAYFAVKMLQWSVDHMLTDYSRDYLIEIVEHEVDNVFDPGPHRKMSLAPGQRYGSRGAVLLRLDPGAPEKTRAISGWMVP